MTDKITGIAKWFSRLKGYGFINPDDGGQEVFVHYSAIDGDGYRNLYEGDRVEFELHSRFMPQGLFGLLYWYVLYPFHQYIFFGMLKAIARSINKPILAGPERFTPKLHTSCVLPPQQSP